MKQTILAEEKTIDALILILKKNLDNKRIISACLFGSVAMKSEEEDSDVDSWSSQMILKLPVQHLLEHEMMCPRLFGNRLSPIIFNERELLEKKDGRLIRSVLNSYIMIHGKEPPRAN